MTPTRVLLTDLDNTLFSWIDYFAPSFRALVHAVSRSSGIDEDLLLDSFQVAFAREGTVEYGRAIQENLAIQQLPAAEQERLVHIGRVAFGRAMRRNLKPYKDVRLTLRRLRDDGVKVIVVTNSSALLAMNRLKQMGLAKLIDGLVAWDQDVTQGQDQVDYQSSIARRSHTTGVSAVRTLPQDSLKPSPRAYQVALELLEIPHSRVWVLGDSLEKDLSSASSVEARSVWARYGHAYDHTNFETLLRITHWSEEKVARTYDTSILTPDYTIDQFDEILEILEIRQGLLF